MRNLASLFGIPAHRMKVPKIVAGSVQTEIEVIAEQPCDGHVCGTRGSCQDESGAALCVCDTGYESPSDCEAGDCLCSKQSCAAHCLTCAAGAVGTCTSCAEPLPLLHGGGCLDTCPYGLYEDKGGACQPCDSTCTACNGPNATDCTACDPIGMTAYLYGRDPLAFLKGGRCTAGCGVGFYADTARECQPCHGDCKGCTGPRASECTSCVPHRCVSSICPPQIKPLLDHTTCVTACPHGTYANAAGVCTGCHAGCQRCNGPGDRRCVDLDGVSGASATFNASACALGAVRAGGACAMPCGDNGTWPQGLQGQCWPCLNFDCSACSPLDGTTCLRCRQDWGVGLYGSKIVGVAPISQRNLSRYSVARPWLRLVTLTLTPTRTLPLIRTRTRTRTRTLSPNLILTLTLPLTLTLTLTLTRPNLLLGACIASCPASMYRNGGGACTACDASCATCDGAGSGTCITCANSSHTLRGGRCAAVCPRGTAANGTNFCLPCHDSCATCLEPITTTVARGANVTTCTSCVANSNKPYLYGDTCTAFCPNSTWANIAAGKCDLCPASCRTCAAFYTS